MFDLSKKIDLKFSREDYNKIARLPKSLAIVPYFNGQSPQKHSSNQTSEIYLIKTVASLKKYAEKVVVTVCNDLDLNTAKCLGFTTKFIETKPGHLPINSLNHFRQKSGDYQYIFYSEADTIWYIKDSAALQEQLDKNRALVPYRMNRVLLNVEYSMLAAGQLFKLDGNYYIVRNWEDHKFNRDRVVINSKYRPVMFSGSWVLPSELFAGIEFKVIDDTRQVECACWNVIDTGLCHKFQRIKSFFVEHLSTFDRKDKDYINLAPHLW